MTAPAPTAAVYPVRRARFVNGRSWHRVKQPDEWHDLLEAACGKTGYLASGYPNGAVGECRGCARAIGADG